MSTTTERSRTESVPSGRLDLFGWPVWTARLVIEAGSLARLVADIDDRLAEFRAPGVAGQHTGSVFQDRDDPWWVEYHTALFAVTDDLAGRLDEPWTERFVRTWGVRYQSRVDYLAGDSHLHSHMGKTFACVFNLQLPAGLVGTTAATTVVRNPQANLGGITGAAAEWHGPSTELTGIVFPALLEHQAELPAGDGEGVGAWDRPRLVVVSDVAYY